MSFGKIFSYEGNPRTTTLLTVAKINGLDVEVVTTTPGKDVSAEYISKHQPLGKVPAFEGADGTKLFECLAIAFYRNAPLAIKLCGDNYADINRFLLFSLYLNKADVLVANQDPNTSILPKDAKAYAEVLQWCSFANSEILPSIGAWFRPTVGRDPYNKKSVDAAEANIKTILTYLDSYLLDNTYLVGERLSLADIVVTAHLDRGFQFLFDPEYRTAYPNVVRFWTLIRNFKPYVEVMGPPKFIEKRAQYTPPKKEAAPKKETAQKPKQEAPKKKEEAPAEEEDDIPKEKAPKHPLGALPPSTIPIDEWKRQYSNNDTDVALKWFWEHYEPKDFSLWRVDYKYPEDLGLTFQTSNLITGFFTRLEASRKYLFGCLLVLGENNNGAISGAFLVRGDDHLAAFDVAPDWESYDFKKLDPSSEADKEFIRDAWTWDKPINGKPIADGKVFK